MFSFLRVINLALEKKFIKLSNLTYLNQYEENWYLFCILILRLYKILLTFWI